LPTSLPAALMLYARGRGDDPNLGDRHASSLESLGVYGDLMAKGQTAMQAADEKMHQNRAHPPP